MIKTANNNIAHKPPGRGACKRSTLLILASSEADPLLVGRGRYYGVGDVGCQDESYSLMVWIRLMVRRICRPLQWLLRQTRRSLENQFYKLPGRVLTVGFHSTVGVELAILAFPLAGSWDCPPRSGSAHSPWPTGRVNVNVDPSPDWLVTQIRPPCSSMNFRESASPSPVPSTFLSAVPTCRNSSKIASWSSARYPRPCRRRKSRPSPPSSRCARRSGRPPE